MPLISAFSSQDDPSTANYHLPHQFTMSNIMSYFVTRCLKDSLPAGDFKSISIPATDHDNVCGFIKSKCLPEMKNDWVYCVHMCLSKTSYDILNAESYQ